MSKARIDVEIAATGDLNRTELVAMWRRTYGRSPAAGLSSMLIRRALVWEAQKKAYGGLSGQTKRALKAALTPDGGKVPAARPSELSLTFDAACIAKAFNLQQDRISSDALSICTPCNLRRRDVETKLVIEGIASKVDAPLLRSVAKGRAWFTEITEGASLKDIADCEGMKGAYIARMIDLAFLSPKMIDAIVARKQPAQISTKSLTRLTLPSSWKEQYALFELS